MSEIAKNPPMPDRPGRIKVWYCGACGHQWMSRWLDDECPKCGAEQSVIEEVVLALGLEQDK